MFRILLFLLAALAGLGPAGEVRAAENMLPDALIHPGDRPGHILVVDKASQMLYLYSHDGAGNISLERVMRCSTGENLGDKMVEGDKKTPNGFYIFHRKLLPRELATYGDLAWQYGTLAYPMDYPNFWDRRLGRGGHGIWMHGTDKALVDNDSSGCIALENAEIAQLEDLLLLFDTPIITYETLTLAPVEDLKLEGRKIQDFLEDWRRAWSGKDHAAYRAKYAPDFTNSDNRSFEGWMAHKENVAKNYRDIRVALNNPRIYRHRDVLVALFEQDYRGDERFTSKGLKRLYLRPEGDGYKIIGEEFRSMPRFDASKRLTPEERHLALTTPPPKPAPAAPAEPQDSRVVTAAARAEEQSRAVEENAGETPSEEGLEVARGSLAAAPEAPPKPAPVQPKPAPAAPAKPAKAEEEARFFTNLVGEWIRAWAAREHEAYFAFYHPAFHYRAKNMDLAAFKIYRSEIMNATERLEIQASDFEVQVWRERARVTFRQHYRSDRLEDRGRKTLTFRKAGPDWKIVSETWRGE